MTTPDPRYLDESEFASWAKLSGAANVEHAARAMAAAEDLLDELAGRRLEIASASPTSRSFRPSGRRQRLLVIDDAASITSVTESGATLTADIDYVAEPYDNRDPNNGQWRPFDRLLRRLTHWYEDDGAPTVDVVADWGWQAIPDIVVVASQTMAADLLAYREIRLGVAGFSPAGFATRAAQTQVVRDAVKVMRGVRATGLG